MKIIIYGKSNCGKCESAKEKLRLMGFEFETHNLEYHINPNDGWRENGAVETMAAFADAHLDFTRPPVIEINGMAYDYAGAMKVLKKIKKKEN